MFNVRIGPKYPDIDDSLALSEEDIDWLTEKDFWKPDWDRDLIRDSRLLRILHRRLHSVRHTIQFYLDLDGRESMKNQPCSLAELDERIKRVQRALGFN